MDDRGKKIDALERSIKTTYTEPKSEKISNEFEQKALEAINLTCGYKEFDPTNDFGIVQALGILEFKNKKYYPEIAKYMMEKPIDEIEGITQIKETIRNREEISSGQLSLFWNETSAPYSENLKYKKKHPTNPADDILYTKREQFILKCYYRKYLAILFAIKILHHNNLLINYKNECDKEEYLNNGRKKLLLQLGFDIKQILEFYDIQIEALMKGEEIDDIQKELKVRKNSNLKKVLRILAWIFVIPILILLCIKFYRRSNNTNREINHWLLGNIRRISFQDNQRVNRIVQLERSVKTFKIKYVEQQTIRFNNIIQYYNKIEELTAEDVAIRFFQINEADINDISGMDVKEFNNFFKNKELILNDAQQEIRRYNIVCQEIAQKNEERRTTSLITIILQIQTSNPDAIVRAFQERAQGIDLDFRIANNKQIQDGVEITLEAYEDIIMSKEKTSENIRRLFSKNFQHQTTSKIVVTDCEIERIIKEEFEPIVRAKDAVIKARLTNTLITTTNNRQNP